MMISMPAQLADKGRDVFTELMKTHVDATNIKKELPRQLFFVALKAIRQRIFSTLQPSLQCLQTDCQLNATALGNYQKYFG